MSRWGFLNRGRAAPVAGPPASSPYAERGAPGSFSVHSESGARMYCMDSFDGAVAMAKSALTNSATSTYTIVNHEGVVVAWVRAKIEFEVRLT